MGFARNLTQPHLHHLVLVVLMVIDQRSSKSIDSGIARFPNQDHMISKLFPEDYLALQVGQTIFQNRKVGETCVSLETGELIHVPTGVFPKMTGYLLLPFLQYLNDKMIAILSKFVRVILVPNSHLYHYRFF